MLSTLKENKFLLPLFLLTLGIGGCLLRVAIALNTYGTNDIDSWKDFGAFIAEHGIFNLYVKDPLFNHPPLIALGVAKLYAATGDQFIQYFKLVTCLADIGLAVLMFFIPFSQPLLARAVIFALYCWNPTSIFISSYHGNTDAVWGVFTVLAFYYLTKRSPSMFLSGVFLALALNIKLIPAIFLPLFFRIAYQRGKTFWHFMIPLIVGSLPSLFVLGFGPTRAFVSNVILYKPFPELWGMSLLSQLIDLALRYLPFELSLSVVYRALAAPLILVLSCLLSFRLVNSESHSPHLTNCFFITYTIFLILTPGFGVQYLYLLPAAAFFISPKQGFFYSVVAGLLLALTFLGFVHTYFPFRSLHVGAWGPLSIVLGLFLWVFLVKATFDVLSTSLRYSPK